jgi:hypothetical protein
MQAPLLRYFPNGMFNPYTSGGSPATSLEGFTKYPQYLAGGKKTCSLQYIQMALL